LTLSARFAGTRGGAIRTSRGAPSRRIGTAAIARAIRRAILAQTGVRTTRVECPPKVPLESGYRLRCVAMLAVGRYPVEVVETNARGGVRYADAKPLRTLDVPLVGRAIARAIRAQRGITATASCPSPVRQQAGLMFTCTAVWHAGSAPFTVTETDDDGHVTLVGH